MPHAQVCPVMIIDDEPLVADSLAQTLSLEGFAPQVFSDPVLALASCSADYAGIVVCDVRMAPMDGLQTLAQLQLLDKQLPVIMLSGHADIAVAIQAIRSGAYDFLEKTCDPEQQVRTVQRAAAQRQLVLENRRLTCVLNSDLEARLVGQTAQLQAVRQSVLQLAKVNVDLIVNGATGTGKEVVARALHDFGPRRDKPFVALNCAALAASVIESELFGHEAGAFTGAQKQRIGKIEYASGGTLFLDEIEGMPSALQAQLLRVLQERSLVRLGGNKEIPVDIRVVAASKEDLRLAADEGRFREDLYYRLNVASIQLPSLAERSDDIPRLFSHFVERASQRFGVEPPSLSAEFSAQLVARRWPGNVRELQNTAERWTLGLPIEGSEFAAAVCEPGRNLDDSVAEYEKALIEAALARNQGRIELTASALGVPRKKLYLRMKKYRLVRDDYLES